jgi:hypothetical protein
MEASLRPRTVHSGLQPPLASWPYSTARVPSSLRQPSLQIAVCGESSRPEQTTYLPSPSRFAWNPNVNFHNPICGERQPAEQKTTKASKEKLPKQQKWRSRRRLLANQTHVCTTAGGRKQMTEMHKNGRKAREKPRIFPQEFDSEKILRARLCSRVRAATRITPGEPEQKGQTRRERNHNNRENR